MNTRKFVTSFLSLIFLILLSTPAYAQNSLNLHTRHVEYQEDGSYFVIEITQESQLARKSTTSGTKSATYYDGSNTAIFTVSVTGTFTYSGTSAIADSASSSVSIYDNHVSFENKGAYTSGASAVGYANVKFNDRLIYKSVTLTCSKDGTLS